MPDHDVQSRPSQSASGAAYRYTFSVRPDEAWKMDRAMFELFRMTGMFEISMAQREFEVFRSGLSHHGLTLREITRIPDAESEVVL